MKVVLTHIGGKPPAYLRDCLRQFRTFNPSVPAAFIGGRSHLEDDAGLLREFNFDVVFTEDLEGDARIRKFCERNWFKNLPTPRTSHPSPPGFWQHTTERLFFVASLMARDRLEDVFHFENDVLIYCDLRMVLEGINRCGGRGMHVTPVGRHWVSCGLLAVDRASSLESFCDFVLGETAKNPGELIAEHGIDMVNDMTLLNIFGDNGRNVSYFPILPHGEHARGLAEFGSIFDGASWGQFVGGTNNGHAPGWVGGHHYVGREILHGSYTVCWEGQLLKRPFAMDRKGRKTPLANLHIHSKNLERFASWTAAPPRLPRITCWRRLCGLFRK